MVSSQQRRLASERILTLQAIGALCLARLLVAVVPLRLWRASLGLASGRQLDNGARFLVGRVERAAQRLPFGTRCLPRAVALSWMLRRRNISHALVIAVRPVSMRTGADALHAWIEADGAILLGALPGPWHTIYRTGEAS